MRRLSNCNWYSFANVDTSRFHTITRKRKRKRSGREGGEEEWVRRRTRRRSGERDRERERKKRHTMDNDRSPVQRVLSFLLLMSLLSRRWRRRRQSNPITYRTLHSKHKICVERYWCECCPRRRCCCCSCHHHHNRGCFISIQRVASYSNASARTVYSSRAYKFDSLKLDSDSPRWLFLIVLVCLSHRTCFPRRLVRWSTRQFSFYAVGGPIAHETPRSICMSFFIVKRDEILLSRPSWQPIEISRSVL